MEQVMLQLQFDFQPKHLSVVAMVWLSPLGVVVPHQGYDQVKCLQKGSQISTFFYDFVLKWELRSHKLMIQIKNLKNNLVLEMAQMQ